MNINIILCVIASNRGNRQGNEPLSGAIGGGHGPLTSTPSQKQSRQQLDKRYLSIRKTISSNKETSSLTMDKFNFDTADADTSLAAAMVSSSISPERQRELLIKVSNPRNKVHILELFISL